MKLIRYFMLCFILADLGTAYAQQQPKQVTIDEYIKKIAVKPADLQIIKDALNFNLNRIKQLTADSSKRFVARQDSINLLIAERKERLGSVLTPAQQIELDSILAFENSRIRANRIQEERLREQRRLEGLPAGLKRRKQSDEK